MKIAVLSEYAWIITTGSAFEQIESCDALIHAEISVLREL